MRENLPKAERQGAIVAVATMSHSLMAIATGVGIMAEAIVITVRKAVAEDNCNVQSEINKFIQFIPIV